MDVPKLERRFHTLSRLFHPDFFQRKSPEEQEVSLANSSVLNKAYRTLRDPIFRLEYLIQIEKGDTEGIRAKAPPDLLEEVLELQEKLEEIRGLKQEGNLYLLENAKGELGKELKSLENRLLKLEGRMIQLSGQWDALFPPGTARGGFVEGREQDQEIRVGGEDADTRRRKGEILSEFRNILSHRTYIMNIIEDIEKELA